MPAAERWLSRHRLHHWALATTFISYPFLYLLPWNPIYPPIAAIILGAIAAMFYRPDLLRKTWLGAILFVGYCALFIQDLEWTAPGYIERMWNPPALFGLGIAGFPIEELLSPGAFSAYWAGVYDHFTWRRLAPADAGPKPATRQ